MLLLQLGGTSLDLDNPANGIIVQEFNPGYPEVRKVLHNVARQDGADDDTAYFGSRVVTIKATIVATPTQTRWQIYDQLSAFLLPGVRPTLTYTTEPSAPQRMFTLRADDHSGPIDTPGFMKIMCAWRSASPIAVGTVLHGIVLSLAPVSMLGRPYSLTFNRLYPNVAGGPGTGIAVNTGGLKSWPRLRIFGLCTNPVITNTNTGEAISFTATINAGDYLDVDTLARTVYLNSDPNASRYSWLNFAATTWWPIYPGANNLRMTASSSGAGASCEVTWRDAYLH